MSELVQMYCLARAGFDQRVRQIRADQWSARTACAEWDVAALLAHVVGNMRSIPGAPGSATPGGAGTGEPTTKTGPRLAAAWVPLADHAERAIRAAESMPTPPTADGGTSATHRLRLVTFDVLVHTWDLAVGIGADCRLDGAVIGWVLQWLAPIAPNLAATGMFAPPVPVGSAVDAQTRLLAMCGRSSPHG